MIRRFAVALAGLIVALAPTASAQQQEPPARPTPRVTVTLSEAMTQAQRNSPAYRQAQNDAGTARWAVRNAYSTMLLPSLTVGGSLSYTGAGSATFGGSLFNQSSPSLSSGYGVNLNWDLSGATLSAPGQQRADQRAIDEDINNALAQLHYDVAFQYLTGLQAVAQTDVARQQLARNEDFLQLAQARYQVGQATILDVKQAQVQRGQAEVALIRAEQTENEAKLELFRRMGVSVPVAVAEVALTDSFPVSEPGWTMDELMMVASEQNPQLRALRARESSASWAVKGQKSRYLPTLSFSAAWRGFTQEFTNTDVLLGSSLASAQRGLQNCTFQNSLIQSLPGGGIGGVPGNGVISDCAGFVGLQPGGMALADSVTNLVRSSNNVFPFSFTRQPFQASVQISLPIFDRFNRDLQIAQARAQREDLTESVRARELQLRTDVQSRLLGLETAYRSIAVQSANRDAARDQLQLAQDRYRLGSGSALEISDAQNSVQRAEGDYVNAIYDYHKAIAALELAVGRPLR
ncbi:MAG: TolC family protein [Gemmatimonadales bacterium]